MLLLCILWAVAPYKGRWGLEWVLSMAFVTIQLGRNCQVYLNDRRDGWAHAHIGSKLVQRRCWGKTSVTFLPRCLWGFSLGCFSTLFGISKSLNASVLGVSAWGSLLEGFNWVFFFLTGSPCAQPWLFCSLHTRAEALWLQPSSHHRSSEGQKDQSSEVAWIWALGS